MEACLMWLMVWVGLIGVAYGREKKRWKNLYFDCNASRGEAWDHAAKSAGELVRLERRLEMCRKDLKKVLRQRAAARGRVTKLKMRVAELEGALLRGGVQ